MRVEKDIPKHILEAIDTYPPECRIILRYMYSNYVFGDDNKRMKIPKCKAPYKENNDQ